MFTFYTEGVNSHSPGHGTGISMELCAICKAQCGFPEPRKNQYNQYNVKLTGFRRPDLG